MEVGVAPFIDILAEADPQGHARLTKTNVAARNICRMLLGAIIGEL